MHYCINNQPAKTMKIITVGHMLGIAILGLFFMGLFFAPNETYATELSVTFSATPKTIEKGGQSSLSWYSENAVECRILGNGIITGGGTKKTQYVGKGSGTVTVAPDKTTVYAVSCKGKDSTFVPAQKELKVTVEGTEDAGDSNTSTNTNGPSSTGSEDFTFTAGCTANPERARKEELVSFTSTSVGGEGTLHYKWTGDVQGGGYKIFEKFTSSGTKTATLTVTDSRGISVVTACNVFIEPGVTSTPTQGTVSQTPSSGSSNQTNTQTGGSNTTPTTGNETQTNGNDQVATASEGGSGTLLLVLVGAIIINMVGLLYFFVYAKKKREEKTRIQEETKLHANMAAS